MEKSPTTFATAEAAIHHGDNLLRFSPMVDWYFILHDEFGRVLARTNVRHEPREKCGFGEGDRAMAPMFGWWPGNTSDERVAKTYDALRSATPTRSCWTRSIGYPPTSRPRLRARSHGSALASGRVRISGSGPFAGDADPRWADPRPTARHTRLEWAEKAPSRPRSA